MLKERREGTEGRCVCKLYEGYFEVILEVHLGVGDDLWPGSVGHCTCGEWGILSISPGERIGVLE